MRSVEALSEFCRLKASEWDHYDDVDRYRWLRDRDHPGTRAYLEAENTYAEQATAHLAVLKEQLIAEIQGRQPSERAPPAFQVGPFEICNAWSGVTLIQPGGGGRQPGVRPSSFWTRTRFLGPRPITPSGSSGRAMTGVTWRSASISSATTATS